MQNKNINLYSPTPLPPVGANAKKVQNQDSSHTLPPVYANAKKVQKLNFLGPLPSQYANQLSRDKCPCHGSTSLDNAETRVLLQGN